MPTPRAGETQKEWMKRCVPVRIEEGDEQEQAVAVCMSMWRNKETDVTDELKDKLWDILTSFEFITTLLKERPMKTVDGKKYPASDFLVVEDPQKPTSWHLQVKRNGTPDHNLMGAAKAALTSPGGHRGNQYQGPNKQEATAKLKRLYASEDMEWTKERKHPFMIWKDDETQEYRWLAVYSNKWRDDDNPPEILASTAHKEFIEAVDKGDWPHPELWLWHIPGSRFGVADFVAYDDSGFALASGTTEKGREYIAEALSKHDDLAMSHGMPVKEIERDEEDPTIITRYRSIEVSPLPREKAANRHGTHYEILTEVKMAIPDEKRSELKGMLGADGLERFEAELADKAKELEELEIQSKSESPEEEAVPEVEEVETEEPESEPKEESKEQEPVYVTAEEVAEAVGAALKPMFEEQRALVLLVESQGETIAEQDKAIKEMLRDDEERLKETIANTPAASLFEQIQSVIGSDETYVDGRTKLAKAGPAETRDERQGPTRVGILNELMDQSWGPQQ